MRKRVLCIVFLVITALLSAAQDTYASRYYAGSGDGYDFDMGSDSDIVSFSSETDQGFTIGDAATQMETITITLEVNQSGSCINTDDDIRITIPAALDMTWDNTDTTADVGGTASAKVSTTVTFEDADKTMVIAVTTNFAEGDTLTVSSLLFTSFTDVSSDSLTLEVDNGGTTAAIDPTTITIANSLPSTRYKCGSGDGYDSQLGAEDDIVSMASEADQGFTIGDSPTESEVITITLEVNVSGSCINTDDDIRIIIPAGLDMTWDSSDTTADIGGTASGKVSTTVTYEDADKTVVIDVTENFAQSDTLTVSGLLCTNFTDVSTGSLTLEVDNAGTTAAIDPTTITVANALPTTRYKCSSGDGYGWDMGSDSDVVNFVSTIDQGFRIGDSPTEMEALTITLEVNQSGSYINTADNIRVTIPASLDMTWDSSDTTADMGGAASGKVSTTVTYEDANKTAVIDVTTNFAEGDMLTVSGLLFANFTDISTGSLTLEVDNAGTIAAVDPTTITVGTALLRTRYSCGSGDGYDRDVSGQSISVPGSGTTVGTTPVVIGIVDEGESVIIKDINGTTVAETTADSAGNFRVACTTALDVGANSLTVYVGESESQGGTVSITVSASPTTDQVPVITSPTEGDTLTGSTPTIEGQGLAGQTVMLYANDANGNLLLSAVATTTVDDSGDYSINADDYSTSLPKGTVYLSVLVGGVSSDLRTITFTDPFGIVFDSVSNEPISGAEVTIYYDDGGTWITAVPGTHIAATDTNPQTTAADGSYSFLCANGDFKISIEALGFSYPSSLSSFPGGRTIVTGSKGETFTVAGGIIEMDHPMDNNGGRYLRIKKEVNKKKISVGDILTYEIMVENISSGTVNNITVEDLIPAGFKYLPGKTLIDSVPAADPAGTRPITYTLGSLTTGETKTIKYQLIVGSGVTYGRYENRAIAKRSTDGVVISNATSVVVSVVPNPLFDLGTVIGKVFHDRNSNGKQDKGEEPIGNVPIVMEDGAVITTDSDGQYHVPALMPGRHLFRLDERTLLEGTILTTPKVVIVDITPGLLSKVNFGVKLSDDTAHTRNPFQVTHDQGRPEPFLHAAHYLHERTKGSGTEHKAQQNGLGNFYTPVCEFRIFTNYQLFIHEWMLEIHEKDTRKHIRTFSGTNDTITEPLFWDPMKDDPSLRTNPFKMDEQKYVYTVTVTDGNGNKDQTNSCEICVPIVSSLDSGETVTKEKTEAERKKYTEWVNQEAQKNSLAYQRIVINGETVTIHDCAKGVECVQILKDDVIIANITRQKAERSGLSAEEVLNQPQLVQKTATNKTYEIILPRGEYDIHTIGLSDSKEHASESPIQQVAHGALSQKNKEDASKAISEQAYTQHLTIGKSYLFFVAMGDAASGYSFTRGNIEPVAHDEKCQGGLWLEGKLAYYLKGKIKGKYLISSSFDSDREKKELFKQIDPDTYYPVYGDDSVINYEATDTQGRFWALVEWDKSQVQWGNFETNFTDTEFASFNRTLYGGKIHYESVGSTQFGTPKTKAVVFYARAQQKAARNEFLGTGGSLYYLKHKDVIEGSEKVMIETRDAVTGLVLSSQTVENYADYDINYEQGRIIFWQPISSKATSSSIISSNLRGGNPVYIVVDYEYEVTEKYDEGSYGMRIEKSITDYVSLGATYVHEEQMQKDYLLKGVDATVHVSKYITVTGEYAESESEATGAFLSTDGGLSFTSASTSEYADGVAYGLKATGQFFNDTLGISAYYKWIDDDFSTAGMVSQQGKELKGVHVIYTLFSTTRLTVSHDIQKIINNGTTQTNAQVGASKTITTTAQIKHTHGRLTATAEYRHQEIKEKNDSYASSSNAEDETLAVRADYKLTDKTTVSLEQQATLRGTPNYQTSAEIMTELRDWLIVHGRETVGTQGNATSVGVITKLKDDIQITTDYTKAWYVSGDTSSTVSAGADARLDDKTTAHMTGAVSESMGERTNSVTLGSTRKVSDNLNITSERTFASSHDTTTQSQKTSVISTCTGRPIEGTFSQEKSQDASSTSQTNIFGLSGNVNDALALSGTYEKGTVQNLDGTETRRHAGSLGMGFVYKNKKTNEVKLKASNKIELRFDQSVEDTRQYLLVSALEGKLTKDLTLFTKANISETVNTTTEEMQSLFKEYVGGVAFRPVEYDWFNAIAKYTYSDNDASGGQSDISDVEREKAHVLAGELVCDVGSDWQLTEKFAYKFGKEKVTGFDFTASQTWLWINRVSYAFMPDWKMSGEYRLLVQRQAEDSKHGLLFELSRRLGEYIECAIGYNFTDFNDDLTHLDYTVHGPYIRITTAFFDGGGSGYQEEKESDTSSFSIKKLINKIFGRYDTQESTSSVFHNDLFKKEADRQYHAYYQHMQDTSQKI